ncbi:hypothetical protein [uncultured Methanobrevibacter sp.]|nr:hypothetical protein [uncultured Methanobrevibacter sp.]
MCDESVSFVMFIATLNKCLKCGRCVVACSEYGLLEN